MIEPSKLTKLRKEAGLTQDDLADLIGVAQGSISGWENKPEIETTTVTLLADAYRVSKKDFWDYLDGKITANGLLARRASYVFTPFDFENGLPDVIDEVAEAAGYSLNARDFEQLKKLITKHFREDAPPQGGHWTRRDVYLYTRWNAFKTLQRHDA